MTVSKKLSGIEGFTKCGPLNFNVTGVLKSVALDMINFSSPI